MLIYYNSNKNSDERTFRKNTSLAFAFVLQATLGFRASDIVNLRVRDFSRNKFSVQEIKTGKWQNREINDHMYQKILEYYKCYSRYMIENGIEFISNYYVPKNKALNTRGYRSESMVNEDTRLINFSCRCLINAEKEGLLKDTHTAIGYANNCCTMLKGIIFDWALNDGNLNMEQLIEEILGTYLNSIKNKI